MLAGGNLALLIAAYFGFVNVVTYAAFWIDKEQAKTRLYRISEATLLLLAFLGGSPAALFARRVLRHKTRKQPFTANLLAIAAIQIGAAFALFLVGT